MYEWIFDLQGLILYIGLFVALVGSAFGLPIPEDIPLIAAGIAVHQETGNLIIVFLVCYFSIILGDIIVFYIGRRFGPNLFNKKWFRSKVPPSKIRKVKINLERKSLLMIFLARHLFYLRTVTFLTCGAVKMKPSRFIAADSVAALVSAPLMIGIGYLAAEHYQTVLDAIHQIELLLIIPLLIIILILLRRSRRGQKIFEKP